MRRTALRTLLLGVAGAAALPTRASAQSCTPPCYAISNAEAASGTTIATEFEPGDVRRYGGDPSGGQDSTTAFNKALALNGTCLAVDGLYRIDGTITIESYQSLKLSHNAKLLRSASHTSNTEPVVHIRGLHSLMDGGTVWSENNSPWGVVCCGARDIYAAEGQSLYWAFTNCWVQTKDFGGANANPYPGDTDGVGVYIGSSQAIHGSSCTNYFGTLQNIVVENATSAYLLTDLANGHTFVNCFCRGIYWYGFRLHGAYGNSFTGGFLEIAHQNGVIGIWLAHKLISSSGTSVHTVRNHFQGITMEFAGSNDVGVHIGNPQSTNNFVQFSWNGIGPAVNDVTNANTVISDVGGARFNNVRVNAPTPTGTGTQISFGNTTSTNVGAAGGAEILPAAPLGYLVADYGGEKIKIPFYRA